MFGCEAVEINNGNVQFRAEGLHGFHVGDERVGFPIALRLEIAADDGGNKDGGGSRLTGVFDVAGEVLLIGGFGVGFAPRTFARNVVVADLDKDEVGFGIKGGLPAVFAAETLGTAAVGGEIEVADIVVEGSAEAGSPTTFRVDAGVADEDDLDWPRGVEGEGEKKKDEFGLAHWDSWQRSFGGNDAIRSVDCGL